MSGGIPVVVENVGGRKLPQREFMWLSKKALENFGKSMIRFLRK